MIDILIYLGSVIITLWGLGHIFPTRSVVKGFGNISEDNKRIITMEWIAEGLTLIFIGILVLSITYLSAASVIVYSLSAGMLLVMAVLSAFTGARTSVLPMKLCPVIKTIVAILILAGTFL